MKLTINSFILVMVLGISTGIYAQQTTTDSIAAIQKANAEIDKKAGEWVASLALNDAAKTQRITNVIATHLKAVRDWNNTHPYTTVPAGINPRTGEALNEIDRQVIASSAIPKSVHEDLMNGLRNDLTEEQVNAILDQYTIGKVAFTMKGYKAIVPDLTSTEDSVLTKNLEQAREQAIDYKSMKQISAIFEIYKTKNEQYLNTHGRNWHELFSTYVKAQKAKKATDASKQN